MPGKKTEQAPSQPTAKSRRRTTTRAAPTRRGNGATAAARGRAPSTLRPGSGQAGSGRSLVIVESPAKARTLAGILGPQFEIAASVGHVRDLPRSKLGVDVDKEFEPHYVVPREKADVVRRIKEAA